MLRGGSSGGFALLGWHSWGQSSWSSSSPGLQVSWVVNKLPSQLKCCRSQVKIAGLASGNEPTQLERTGWAG